MTSLADYPISPVDLPVSYRFLVVFFALGVIPNPLDIRFQKVSGLSLEVNTRIQREGGENIFSTVLPEQVSHGNLILERGAVIGSPLNLEFNAALNFYKFSVSNVLVSLLDANYIPTAGWLFLKAYPVKWSVSDLNGESNSLVIDTLELAYQRFQILRI